MRREVGKRFRSSNSSGRSLLRTLGRGAIWTALGLLLVRGLGAVVSTPQPATQVPAPSGSAADLAGEAFAIRFARTYLAEPSGPALAPFLAEGASLGTGRPPGTEGAEVGQAEVSSSEGLGGGTEILTVACELRDSRTLYLAVPIVRSVAGEVATLGAPSIVAAPGVAGVDSGERPQPLAGSESAAIEGLVAKFLPQYVSAGESASLSYLLAPGAVVEPLGGALDLVGISGVTQLGSTEGPRRSVLAAARVSDPASGATYPLVYRLELVRGGGRWYVSSVEGESS